MGILKPKSKDKNNNDIRQASLLMVVPAMLITGPLIGLFGGRWLDEKFETEPLLLIIGLIFGFASAGVETYKLIKKAESFNKEKDDDK